MHSIRTKFTLLNVIAISATIVVTTTISGVSIAMLGHSSSEKELSLTCEEGKSDLNYYFKSIEQSVATVSNLIDANLDTLTEDTFVEKFHNHIEQSRIMFGEAAKNTNGVLTYYYRIDPEISDITNEKGFWYTNLDGKGFVEHEVTDISDDQYECLWFYIPKESGEPVWLPPYITDNLDEIVLSYNVPVYDDDMFVGVVGIELSYHTLGEQIKNIKVNKTGFAFIVENERGSIIYHPYIDILSMSEDERPSIPKGFLEAIHSENHHLEYTFQGVRKHACWLRLSNDMSIVTAVPQSEIVSIWLNTVLLVAFVSVALIAICAIITVTYTRKITKPLIELSVVAEKINRGNYDIDLSYNGDDEIGVLTSAVNKLVNHLGGYIQDLNSLAYSDALTSVHNKSAFDIALNEIQSRILDPKEKVEFAIAIFDCDDLKTINDKYGHDKGNVYLKNSSLLIARVFQNSEVYRLGGDEFAVILQNEDYKNREKLKKTFIEKGAEICSFAKEEWEKIKVSVGIAIYDPDIDKTAEDVMIHADHLMYENKRNRKKKNT